MHHASTRALKQHSQVLNNAQRLLDSFATSRDRLLEQGYVWVSDADGAVLPRANAVQDGMALKLHFIDGSVDAVAGTGGTETPPKPAARPKKTTQAAAKSSPSDQGSLL